MSTAGHDVFLSYAFDDASAAAVVRSELEEGGLSVYDVAEQPKGEEGIWQQVRDALTESEAIVLVLDRSTLVPNLAVEIGAALAWSKPIFVVSGRIDPESLPSYIQSFRRFDITALRPLVDAIRQSKAELNEPELNWLRDWYARTSVPLDQVLRDPSRLDRLATEFERQWHRSIAAQRLLQALLRLRKRGELPRVGGTGR